MRGTVGKNNQTFERLTFWVSCSIAFLVYLLTLGVGLTFGDGGRLVAATTWGIAAPPGYPVWSFLSNVVCTTFDILSFGTLSNPAFAVGFLSVCCSALTVGFFARLLWCIVEDLYLSRWGDGNRLVAPLIFWGCCCIALLFACLPKMWFLAVCADVGAWEGFLFASILFWSYRVLRLPSRGALGWLFFFWGLTLTQGVSFIWLGVPIWIVVVVTRPRLASSFLLIFIPVGLLLHLLSIGALPSAYDPSVVVGHGKVLARPMAVALHGVVPISFASSMYYIGIGVCLLLGIGSLWFWPRLNGVSFVFRRVVCHWWLGILFAALGVLIFLFLAMNQATYFIPPKVQDQCFSFWPVWCLHLVMLTVVGFLCARFHRSRRYALAVIFVDITLLVLFQYGFMMGLTHPRVWWFWWPFVWGACLLLMGRRWLCGGRSVVACCLCFLLGIMTYLYVPWVTFYSASPEQWGSSLSWVGFHHLLEDGFCLPSRQTFEHFYQTVWVSRSEGEQTFFWMGVVGLVILAFAGKARHRLRWLFSLIMWLCGSAFVLLSLPKLTPIHITFFDACVHFILMLGIGGGGLLCCLAYLRRLQGPALTRGVLVIGLFVSLLTGSFFFWGTQRPQTDDVAWQWGTLLLEGAPQMETFLTPEVEPLPDPFWPPPLVENAVLLSSSTVPYFATASMGIRSDVKVVSWSQWSEIFPRMVARSRYEKAGIWFPDEKQIATLQERLSFKTYETMTEGLATEEEKLAVVILNAFLEHNVNTPLYLDARAPYRDLRKRLEPAGVTLKVALDAPSTEAVGMRDIDFWDWYSRHLNTTLVDTWEVSDRQQFVALQLALAELYRGQGYARWSTASLVTAMSVYPIDAIIDYVESCGLRSQVDETAQLSLSEIENALRMLQIAKEKDPQNEALMHFIETVKTQKKALEYCKSLQVPLNKGTISVKERCLYIDACLQLNARNEAREVAWGFEDKFIPPTLVLEVLRTVMRLETPELVYNVANKMPVEMYQQLTEREVLELVDIALDYQHRSLVQLLLKEGEKRFGESAPLHWMKARYYHVYEDPSLAYHHLQRARALSAHFMDERSDEEKRLCQMIEDRYQRH